MDVVNSTLHDLSNIFDLYKTATELIKSKNQVAWPTFSKNLITQEIEENRQWKLIIDNKIACVWATTDSDPQIWKKRNEDPAIYIHRISTNPEFRGKHLVNDIVKWSISYVKENKKT